MIVIEDIYWERVNLHILFSQNLKGLNLYLMSGSRLLHFTSDSNELVLNVTNTPEGKMFDKGKWKLIISEETIADSVDYANRSDSLDHNFVISDQLIRDLDDKSRIFKYRRGICAYIVDFSIDKNYSFYIHSNFMIENRSWKHFYLFQEGDTLRKKFIILLKKMYLAGINLYYRFMRLFKFNRRKNVLFFTENSDSLTGNLKILYDSVEEGTCHKLSYANDNFNSHNKKITKKIFSTLKGIYLLAISDIIFVDNYVPKLTHIRLNKKTRLIQLWHAGVGFKSVGYARFGLSGSPHPCRCCHRNYTDVVVDQDNLIDIYKEVFGVRTEIFRSLGMPRLDGYLSRERIESVTQKLYAINGDLKLKKVILFSPTFRGTGSNDAYYDYSLLDLAQIYSFCLENDFLFVIKMHPFIEERIEIPEKYADVILDYTEFEINDLIYISDIMITDYSSCAYEFSLFNRPLIFYRFDKELYEYLRPMHSLKVFSEEQFEVRTFGEVLEVLNKLKDIDISRRFENIRENSVTNACEEIIRTFMGD